MLTSMSWRSSVVQPRRLFGNDRRHQRPYAELLGALAFQRHVGDAAFDHLDTNRAVGDVLRRHDGAAEVEAGGAVDVTDTGGDRHEIGLRDLFADKGLPHGGELPGARSPSPR